MILEGTATVTRAGRVVNILHAGDYFGELAAIEAEPRSATVQATTDLDVLIVGPREFEAMMVRQMLTAAGVGGKDKESPYAGMQIDAIAKGVTAGRGLGLAQQIADALAREAHTAHKK